MKKLIALLSSFAVAASVYSQSITLDSEWDTAAGINTATTDQDFLLEDGTIALTGPMTYDLDTGITAATPGGQGDGATSAEKVNVTVVGTNLDGVTALTLAKGSHQVIWNNDASGSNTLEVWPVSGDDIGGGLNTAVVLKTGEYIVIEGISAAAAISFIGNDTSDPVFTGTLDVDAITTDAGAGLDSQAAGALLLGAATATSVEIADTGVNTDIQGNVTVQGTTNKLPVFTEAHAASHTLTAAECWGSVYYVTSAATLTLPPVEAGMSLTVCTVGAIAVSVDPNASDLIVLDGITTLGDGDKATNLSTAGDLITLTYYDATGWYGASNGWTDGGP